jgi:hypothetical protein
MRPSEFTRRRAALAREGRAAFSVAPPTSNSSSAPSRTNRASAAGFLSYPCLLCQVTVLVINDIGKLRERCDYPIHVTGELTRDTLTGELEAAVGIE